MKPFDDPDYNEDTVAAETFLQLERDKVIAESVDILRRHYYKRGWWDGRRKALKEQPSATWMTLVTLMAFLLGWGANWFFNWILL